MAEKLTRKELKQPDAFQKAGTEAREWVEQRQRMVVIVVVIAFLGGTGAAVASYVSSRGEEKAAQELALTLKVLSRPVVTVESPAPPDQDPPFKSEKEKDEGIKKVLENFRVKYKGTRASETAALTLGEAEYRLGEYDQALGAFNDYLKSVPSGEPLRQTALEGQGYAYESKNQLDKALEAFQALSKESKGEFMGGMGQYHQARILILQGKKEEAARLLTELNTAHPGTAASRMATDRLAMLAGEGVKIPTPPASTLDAGHP